VAKKISMTLSRSSINDAINELKAYKKELINKNEIFVRRLAELGIKVIDMRVQQSLGDSDDAKSSVYVDSVGKITSAELHLTGSDVLFIEFGAGIYYNTPGQHPLEDKFGMGVGTYPGQTHAFDDYWFYTDEQGNTGQISYGTQATMPMYSASIEMYQEVTRIAREVFGG
jgi:hypothetical protein